MPIQNNLQNSEAVREIISNRPGFLVRYGISFFFIILCLVGLISWFVKYPDTVLTRATLTSINPPKTVITNTNGKLIKLFAKENDTVSKNQIIGYVEAIANHEEVLKLSSNLNKIQALLNNNNSELIQQQLSNSFTNLGELQTNYQIFASAFLSFKNYLSNGFYLRKKNMLG